MANTESKKVAGLIERFLNLSPEDQVSFDHAYAATKRAIARYNGTFPETGRRRGRPRRNLPYVPPEEICREIEEEEALAAVPEPSPVPVTTEVSDEMCDAFVTDTFDYGI